MVSLFGRGFDSLQLHHYKFCSIILYMSMINRIKQWLQTLSSSAWQRLVSMEV